MKLKPMLNKLLLKKTEETERRTDSGLYIPDTQQQQTMVAKVMAVGPGNEYWDTNKGEIVAIPLKVKVGDTVVIPRFNTTEVMFEGETLVMINENEIFGVVSE